MYPWFQPELASAYPKPINLHSPVSQVAEAKEATTKSRRSAVQEEKLPWTDGDHVNRM
jgi:hypothetical protein